MSDPASRSDGRWLGLYPQGSFRFVEGDAAGDTPIRAARWYFATEIIAVPRAGDTGAGYERGVRAQDDVRRWQRGRSPNTLDHPPLVWIAARDTIRHARISPDATAVTADGASRPFALAARHPLNRSWFDASSAAFFASRETKLRGADEGSRFVARTLWPEDFALPRAAPIGALDRSASMQLALRGLVREQPQGGARSPFDARALWRRDGAPSSHGAYVLALVLTGAQGDDDEAHAGHFALATGVVEHDGAIGDWIADNFYALDSESEKGIIGAPVPLDNYLADVNAGQLWYRPGALLVAVLREPRAAALVQGAMNRVYNHFYRHQLHYDHAAMNCTGISVDTLRSLGLDVAPRVPAWRPLAPLALPWLVAAERSLDAARRAYDYATEDATRLLPLAAFEEIGASLLGLAAGTAPARGELAAMLAADVDEVVFARMPQIPSSRAWGDAPVASLREYRDRLPARRDDMVVVPVPPRPFPSALRDDDLTRPPWRRSSVALALWSAVAIAALVALAFAS